MNKSRAILIFIFVLIAFVGLVAKLYKIQVKKHDYYKFVALKQQYKKEIVKAERGSIFDRNNNLLAYTKNDISFYVDNRMSKKQVSDTVIAEKFSKVFGKDFHYYLRKLQSPQRRVCLEKKVPRDYALKLSNFIVDRLYYEEDYSRLYPYGSLASHVIGFVDRNLIGRAGIERKFEDYLKGVDGKLVIEKDVSGRIVSIDQRLSVQPKNGDNVILTIDKNIQKILEEELLNGLQKYDGKAAVGIVLNPNTGEILALADLPNYDPGNYNLFDASARRNRAISDTYEPGSTMKTVLFAMLFQDNLVREDETINTENGRYVLYRKAIIKDTHPAYKLTVKQILTHSSNIGAVKLSFRINENKFYKYLRDFGFGNVTGIDIPGEVAGKLIVPSKFQKTTKAYISHGYGISVTPLQMTMAYAALINGGVLLHPEIVKEVRDVNGNVVKSFWKQKIRKVISEKTSAELRKLLVDVVENGTGEKAQLPDILVGGKTGTAQKLIDKKYSSFYYNSSFIGFFPAEEPKYEIFILVDSPTRGRYGGQVAAPIFRNIAERIVNADISLAPFKKDLHRTKKSKANFVKELVSTNKENLYVAADVPNVKRKAQKTRFLNRKTLPNFVGFPLRKALATASALGIKLEIKGSGKVIWQNFPPGTKIKNIKKLTLKCGR